MIKIKTLNSGVRLAVNEMKGFEGVSVKLFVFVGSSNEKNEKDYGISHLIEHMFFKGTKTRTSLDIVKEFDKYGIQTNAYTTKTNTCYFTYGTKDTVEKSVELLSDMFFNSTFDSEELIKEKQVVVEEINMYQDMPDSQCEILMDSIFYNGTTFAHDIAGTEESVSKISRKQILDYYNKNYTPKNIILSLAGNISFEEAEKLINKYFEKNFKQKESFVYSPIVSNFKIEKNQAVIYKDTNQAQVKIAYKTTNNFNENENRLNLVISYMLGGGMSSRLFQEVREKLGLVYTIYSSNDVNYLSGMFNIGFGTNLKNLPLALKTIRKVIEDVKQNGFSKEELMQAKNMLISSIKLRSDSPSDSASNMAFQLQNKNRIINKEEMIELYKQISLKEVNNQLKNIFTDNYCITMVSSKNDLDLLKSFD